MELTKQEQEAIEREAESYSGQAKSIEHGSGLYLGYSAAATAYALKAKVLVEALDEILCDWHLHISKPMVDKIRKSLAEYNNQ